MDAEVLESGLDSEAWCGDWHCAAANASDFDHAKENRFWNLLGRRTRVARGASARSDATCGVVTVM
jgi:hypothetical protein